MRLWLPHDAQLPARWAPFQRFHGLSRWQLHATENGRSGDLFAAMGCTIETMLVPIGASFAERGMRNHQHDAVAATFWIPYEVVPDAEPPRSRTVSCDSDRHGDDAQVSASTAAASSKGGAAQHANDDDGATQRVPASPTASSSSPQKLADWSPDVETDAVVTAAETLHQALKTLEENEEDQRVMHGTAGCSSKRECMKLMAVRCSTSRQRKRHVVRSPPSCGEGKTSSSSTTLPTTTTS